MLPPVLGQSASGGGAPEQRGMEMRISGGFTVGTNAHGRWLVSIGDFAPIGGVEPTPVGQATFLGEGNALRAFSRLLFSIRLTAPAASRYRMALCRRSPRAYCRDAISVYCTTAIPMCAAPSGLPSGRSFATIRRTRERTKR